MSELIDTIDLGHGYTGEIYYDDIAGNPLVEYSFEPILIMHSHAEQHCGWTTDEGWAGKLEEALERGRESMAHVHAVFQRWARVYLGAVAIRPFCLHEHSGQTVYLGEVGYDRWDSAWVGYVLITDAQWREWQMLKPEDPIDYDRANEALEGSFKQFAAYVEGDEIDSCWGYLGEDWSEGTYLRSEMQSIVRAHRAEIHSTRVDLFKMLVAS
jgi:hypothetical protein